MESTHVENGAIAGDEPAPLVRALALITNFAPGPDPTLADTRSGFERMLAGLPVPGGRGVAAPCPRGGGGVRGCGGAGARGGPPRLARATPPAPRGGVRCLRVRATASPTAAMLMLHSGGYVMGSADGYVGFAGALAHATGTEVVACDYRLAPEHPFPAALDDARAAFDSLAAQYGAQNVVVLGDSAGGGLTTGLLMSLRDAGVAPPACGVVICPELDLTASSAGQRPRDSDPVVKQASVRRNGGRYLGGRDPRATPYASPHFGSGNDLPPLLIVVTDTEFFYDEAVDLAERVTAAGGQATLSVYPGLFHIWPLFWSFLPEAQQAVDEIADFVTSRLPGARRPPEVCAGLMKAGE